MRKYIIALLVSILLCSEAGAIQVGNLKVEGNSVPSTRTFSIPVTNPDTSVNQIVWRSPWDITITSVNGVCMDGTSLTCAINECDGDGDNASAITASTEVTTSNTAFSISNAGVDAGDYVSFTSSAESGDVTKMIVVVEYTID